jgi:hypothetical protein
MHRPNIESFVNKFGAKVEETFLSVLSSSSKFITLRTFELRHSYFAWACLPAALLFSFLSVAIFLSRVGEGDSNQGQLFESTEIYHIQVKQGASWYCEYRGSADLVCETCICLIYPPFFIVYTAGCRFFFLTREHGRRFNCTG